MKFCDRVRIKRLDKRYYGDISNICFTELYTNSNKILDKFDITVNRSNYTHINIMLFVLLKKRIDSYFYNNYYYIQRSILDHQYVQLYDDVKQLIKSEYIGIIRNES